MFKLPLLRAINPLIVRLHNDPAEYEERLIKAKYKLPEVLDGIVDEYILPNDSVLDLGCGTGAVAKILEKHSHKGKRIANDISESMVQEVLNQNLYNEGFHGTAEELAEELVKDNKEIDWVVALSVFYYFSPGEIQRTLVSLLKVCQKGMIISLDGIPPQFTNYVSDTLGSRLELYDHREYFNSQKLPDEWTAKVVYEGFGWQSSKTGIEIPAQLVVITKSNF